MQVLVIHDMEKRTKQGTTNTLINTCIIFLIHSIK